MYFYYPHYNDTFLAFNHIFLRHPVDNSDQAYALPLRRTLIGSEAGSHQKLILS